MKYILILILIFSSELFADETIKEKRVLTVHEKKKRFYTLVVPVIEKVYNERYRKYETIKQTLQIDTNSSEIQTLKEFYKVKTDQDLLMALKPQPKSMAIAQAAIESAWATSRFFKEGNNLFGMWSISKKEQRIAAKEKRENDKTVWVKKYKDLEASVKGYYLTLAKGKRYKRLRELNFQTHNVLEVIAGLDKYSERGVAYVEEIAKIIKYNKLVKYDKM